MPCTSRRVEIFPLDAVAAPETPAASRAIPGEYTPALKIKLCGSFRTDLNLTMQALAPVANRAGGVKR